VAAVGAGVGAGGAEAVPAGAPEDAAVPAGRVARGGAAADAAVGAARGPINAGRGGGPSYRRASLR
jgi:hypothetical protein